MTAKFNYIVCSIEESKDIDTLSLDELQGSLLVHEQKINQQDKDEVALKALRKVQIRRRSNGKEIIGTRRRRRAALQIPRKKKKDVTSLKLNAIDAIDLDTIDLSVAPI